jgi:phosphate/sulfate permease
MNQKQLANVLTKILGLSLCADGAMRAINGIISLIEMGATRGIFSIWLLNSLDGLVSAAIGIFFIVRSRWLVEKLFKDETE